MLNHPKTVLWVRLLLNQLEKVSSHTGFLLEGSFRVNENWKSYRGCQPGPPTQWQGYERSHVVSTEKENNFPKVQKRGNRCGLSEILHRLLAWISVITENYQHSRILRMGKKLVVSETTHVWGKTDCLIPQKFSCDREPDYRVRMWTSERGMMKRAEESVLPLRNDSQQWRHRTASRRPSQPETRHRVLRALFRVSEVGKKVTKGVSHYASELKWYASLDLHRHRLIVKITSIRCSLSIWSV